MQFNQLMVHSCWGSWPPGLRNLAAFTFRLGIPNLPIFSMDELTSPANMFREVEEETELSRAFFIAEPGWVAVLDGQLVALIRILTADEPATELRKRIFAHLEREETPELADIRIVRSRSDLDPMMPAFVQAYLKQAFD